MPEKSEIEELKKQLEEEREMRKKLEFEIQYEDSITKLANQRYLEKILEEGELSSADPNLSVIYTQVSGIKFIYERNGIEIGDKVLRIIAELLRECFGETADRFKMVGDKFCTIVSLSKSDFDASMDKFNASTDTLKESYSEIDFTNGFARLENYENKSVDVVLREAEYDLHMKNAEKDIALFVGDKERNRPKKTVLMIDDSLVQLRTQKAILQEQYSILMTTSGMEGYEIAKTKHPDLILLDYNMPIVDGRRIMNLLRKSEATKNIPVVFISGVSEKNKFLEVASLNPEGYLLKPVSQEDLLSIVFKVLNK